MIRTLLKVLQWIVILVTLLAVVSLVLRLCSRAQVPVVPAEAPPSAALPEPRTPAFGQASCDASAFAAAARDNAASVNTVAWAPYRRPELGWAIYAPAIAQTLGTSCGPETPAFAAALAGWQRRHRLPASGRLDEATFGRMKLTWFGRGLHMRAAGSLACPDAPAESSLAVATPAESYGGKTILLRHEALAAYRRMMADARREAPTLAGDPLLLTIFSGYRSPAADDARCTAEGNCQGITRAACSPHRTGLALDLNLGAAPGFRVDSSADPNRLYMSRTPAYRWLVTHAGRYGFVNYPFEPWHWEFVGSQPAPDGPGSNGQPRSATPPS